MATVGWGGEREGDARRVLRGRSEKLAPHLGLPARTGGSLSGRRGQTGDREVHTWPWVTLRFTASRGRPIFLLFNWKDLVFPASHFAK